MRFRCGCIYSRKGTLFSDLASVHLIRDQLRSRDCICQMRGVIVLGLLASAMANAAEWSCDIRAWTRAPDLYPGAVLAGDARMALSGRDCHLARGWAIGLRLKERAVIKKWARDAPPMPLRPSHPPHSNDTKPSVDPNDIYSPRSVINWNRNAQYEQAMEEYKRIVRDPSMWEVRGAERVVFDVVRDLPSTRSSADDDEIDVVERFNIRVPLTNFPPMENHDHSSRGPSKDQQMLSTETLFEYYHLITCPNGTVLDIPAGRSGFLPATHPTSFDQEALVGSTAAPSWPKTADLKTPDMISSGGRDWEEVSRFGSKRPAFDNNARFHVSVQPDAMPVQGRNLTVNVTLTRVGTGFEYPRFIDFRPALQHDITWGQDLFESELEHRTFADEHRRERSTFAHFSSYGSRMLMVKPVFVLEQERDRRERDRDAGPVSTSRSYPIGKHPARPGTVRYDFEEMQNGEQDVYNFTVELPISYDQMPTFARTFDLLQSVIDITLSTAFIRDEDRRNSSNLGRTEMMPDGRGFSTGGDIIAVTAEHAKGNPWEEYQLPLRLASSPLDRKPPKGSREYFRHRGVIPLGLQLNQPIGNVKHYTDPTAYGPVLSLPGEDYSEFRLLDTRLRDERLYEALMTRYGASHDPRRQRGPSCSESNVYDSRPQACGKNGGGWMHAGKIWQAVEMAADGDREFDLSLDLGDGERKQEVLHL